MSTVLIILATMTMAPAVLLFLDGFSNPDKETGKNESLMAVVLLITRIYHIAYKFGAWLRRIFSGIGHA